MNMAKIIKAIGEAIAGILKAIVCSCKGGCCESDCNKKNNDEDIEEIRHRIDESDKRITDNENNIKDIINLDDYV